MRSAPSAFASIHANTKCLIDIPLEQKTCDPLFEIPSLRDHSKWFQTLDEAEKIAERVCWDVIMLSTRKRTAWLDATYHFASAASLVWTKCVEDIVWSSLNITSSEREDMGVKTFPWISSMIGWIAKEYHRGINTASLRHTIGVYIGDDTCVFRWALSRYHLQRTQRDAENSCIRNEESLVHSTHSQLKTNCNHVSSHGCIMQTLFKSLLFCELTLHLVDHLGIVRTTASPRHCCDGCQEKGDAIDGYVWR